MCIGGGVYIELPIAERLTDYVYVGGDRHLGRLERLFHCLTTAVDSLQNYYSTLSTSVGEGVCGFPYICEYDGRTFSYVERLGPDPEKKVYKVKEGDKFRVVKFATQYNEAAHRLLAEERDGELCANSSSRQPIDVRWENHGRDGLRGREDGNRRRSNRGPAFNAEEGS
jgi:hypothetical protein